MDDVAGIEQAGLAMPDTIARRDVAAVAGRRAWVYVSSNRGIPPEGVRRGAMMSQSVRTGLLMASALLMLIGAAGYLFVILPDLHGDLVEIGVRPSVLGATVLQLRYAAMVRIGFTVIVAVAAVQSLRGVAPARLPLAVIAVIDIISGVMAFSRSHNPHHLGPIAMGVLLGVALMVRVPSDGGRT
jgi:hypothetical protein